MAKEWVDLIGTPFESGNRGPKKYDCYGLLMEMYRRDGITIPDYVQPESGGLITALIASELNRVWTPVKRKPGAVVVIRTPGNMHVGYVLDDMHMLHTWEKSGGVVKERLDLWERRIVGYYEYTG